MIEFVEEKTEYALENGLIKDAEKQDVRTTLHELEQWMIQKYSDDDDDDIDSNEDSDLEVMRNKKVNNYYKKLKAAGSMDLPLEIRFKTCWVRQKNGAWNPNQVSSYYINHWKEIYKYYVYVLIHYFKIIFKLQMNYKCIINSLDSFVYIMKNKLQMN